MTNWLIRLAYCIPLLLLVALVVKWYMIKPYSIGNGIIIIEEYYVLKKGDKEI